MFARMATFEGAEPALVDALVTGLEQEARRARKHLSAKELVVLADRDRGTVVVLMLFATEEARRAADEALRGAQPDGQRADVRLFDVPLRLSL